MKLTNHLNLINNHNYDGWIAIYSGPDQMSTRNGAIVLVKNVKPQKRCFSNHGEYDKKYATIETPLPEEKIQENLKNNNGIKTIGTCVGVPRKYLEKIEI
jgi:hypothetical protein